MAERMEAAATGDDDYTQDGTVDLRGNPVLRSKRGGWKACGFVVGVESGVELNPAPQLYVRGVRENGVLRDIIEPGVVPDDEAAPGTVSSVNNVTNWVGTIWMTPILGAYIVDAHLGRYRTFMIASLIYLIGMSLLTLAVSVPSLKPPKCGAGTPDPSCSEEASSLQLGVFFVALYILAVGTGGTKPNISTIGADQFDDHHPRERRHKLSFFNWWMFSIFFGTLFANTVLVYLQDNVGYALPNLGLAVSIAIFTAGTPFYRHKPTSGSSFARMARVIVAAARKLAVTLPDDARELHELDDPEQGGGEEDHAAAVHAVPEDPEQGGGEDEHDVEGTTLDRRVGGGSFEIPPASLQAFVTISMLVSVVLYDRVFMPLMARATGNPRGITLLQRMGVGLVIHIAIMGIASATERHRLAVARAHGVADSKGTTIPLTIFVLLPQFVLMGVADAFLEVAKIEFFYDQAPEGMKSLGTSYAMTSLGVGNFLSSLLLSTVAHVTRRHGGGAGWIQNNLNASRLDHYYAFFAVLNCVNLVFFFLVCRLYVYNAEVSRVVDVGGSGGGEGGEVLRPKEVAMVDTNL
ncbi:hypothetical protein OsI_33979 [Oryza sativa Indica Group]|uniref:Uncharacterized protein n=1 Tax=Oryza sativa subsp. indica TaxID=39946 RepID=B8BHE5_ORYSI|nr:hypothetical protein OsI_33979 [Oryza sativa Indica Group]